MANVQTQESNSGRPAISEGPTFSQILAPLASLKLTVALFAMSAFLVLAGTFAQVDLGIWDVMKTYFRSYLIWIDLKVFFPPLWFPNLHEHVAGGFWFPGGRSLGLALLANITAAHMIRFKVQGTGRELVMGWIIIGIGCLITTMVILYGNYKDGVQDKPWFDWIYLWYAIMAGITVLDLAGFASLFLISKERRIEKTLTFLASVGLTALLIWIFKTSSKLDDASLKILWNMIQGTIASLVLLLGCNLVFKRRGGIVLLHAGIALLMINELWIASAAIEEQITLEENTSTDVARDVRSVELTITNRSHEDMEEVLAVPQEMLITTKQIKYPSLPFDIKIEHFFRNSRLEPLREDRPQIKPLEDASNVKINRGEWTKVRVVEKSMVGGVKGGNEADNPSAIITIVPHDSKEDSKEESEEEEESDESEEKEDANLGTYLLSFQFSEFPETVDDDGSRSEKITVDGKEYELSLHLKRNYKPYSIKLIDVEKEDYVGTETPKSYWSSFEITDKVTGEVLPANIRMNEPLRFRGETFYQSGYRDAAGGKKEVSTFQVVTNDGWMIPYMSCCIVGFGMLAQFSTALFRFLLRVDREMFKPEKTATAADVGDDEVLNVEPESESQQQDTETLTTLEPSTIRAEVLSKQEPERKSQKKGPGIFIILPIVLLVGAVLIYPSVPRKLSDDQPRLDVIGQFPIASGGRVMPLDSFARVMLEKISERQEVSYIDADYEENKKEGKEPAPGDLIDWKKHTAMEWLMDVIARKEGIDDVRIFRIYDPKVQSVLGLSRRKGYRYSFNEINKKIEDFSEALEKAGKVPEKDRRQYHAAISKLSTQFMAYDQIKTVSLTREAIVDEIRKRFGEDELPETDAELISRMAEITSRQAKAMKKRKLPLFVPRQEESDGWETLAIAQCRSEIQKYAREKEETETRMVADMIWKEKVGDPEALIDRLLPRIVVEDLVQTVQKMSPGISADKLREQAKELYETRPPQFERLISSIERDAVMKLIERIQMQRGEVVVLFEGIVGSEKIPEEENIASEKFVQIMDYYRDGETEKLNEAAKEYLALMKETEPLEYSSWKVSREFFYNSFSPFYVAIVLFVAAFVFAIFGWIGWAKGLNWISFGLNAIATGIVLYGTVERCLISGRPPVTNLYSSAVFIALSIAVIGLAIQILFRIGIGNLLCAVGGTIALLIARNLSAGEDTFEVVVAVLDTQFWLATHVLCITLGYATTYAAGLLGIRYVVKGVFVPRFGKESEEAEVEKQLTRMIYGMTCFAILFSFVGTVLGGLWADVSWGRFWGWDPKENGALIIVIWNALILHARWGGMVRNRGLALLAIGGCIVTTWSWFGVNQLGIGLHSYGFTEGVLKALLISSAVFLGLITIGLYPQRFWMSRQVNFSKEES